MGYTTAFDGKLEFETPVSKYFRDYINRFCNTRRMKRSNEDIKKLKLNWEKYCFCGKLGKYGEFYAPDSDWFGQEEDGTILSYNSPPPSQPSLWCDWKITDDCKYLEWNGAEKFYDYIEWLKYIIENFVEPKKYVLNGLINWKGEDDNDIGSIFVKNNEIFVLGVEHEETD